MKFTTQFSRAIPVAAVAAILLIGGASSAMATTFARDLTLGSSGGDVTELQNFLIKQGFPISAGATGYFGAQTKAALASYQAAHGIVPAAGYFGPVTRGKVAVVDTNGGTTGGNSGNTGSGTTLSGREATIRDFKLTGCRNCDH
jgi:peptidoglycan hydrolase-like protein with peptidoglycan-binding domain